MHYNEGCYTWTKLLSRFCLVKHHPFVGQISSHVQSSPFYQLQGSVFWPPPHDFMCSSSFCSNFSRQSNLLGRLDLTEWTLHIPLKDKHALYKLYRPKQQKHLFRLMCSFLAEFSNREVYQVCSSAVFRAQHPNIIAGQNDTLERLPSLGITKLDSYP